MGVVQTGSFQEIKMIGGVDAYCTQILFELFQSNCGLDECMQALQATLIPGGDISPASNLNI